jgi:hypothetical protein
MGLCCRGKSSVKGEVSYISHKLSTEMRHQSVITLSFHLTGQEKADQNDEVHGCGGAKLSSGATTNRILHVFK